MLSKLIIINYITKLNHANAKSITNRIGVFFDDEEINIVLPYLKRNIQSILYDKYPKRKIHTDLKNKVNMDTINKLYRIFDRLNLA